MRVVVKLGSSSLTDRHGTIDAEAARILGVSVGDEISWIGR